MDRIVDGGINLLNSVGQAFCVHAWSAFVQSSVLIVVLLVLDLLLRKRVRAVVRYSVWMLVFVKLLLPPTLSLPTGIGYYWPRRTAVLQVSTEPVAEETVATSAVEMVRSQHVSTAIPSTDTVEVSVADTRHNNMVPVLVSPVAVRPAVAWQVWVFLSWLGGVVALGICLLRRLQYVRKLVRDSTPASDSLQNILAQCAAKLGLRRCPQLQLSDDAPGPVVAPGRPDADDASRHTERRPPADGAGP